MMKKKPGKFERMVQNITKRDSDVGYDAILFPDDAVTLLMREHRAVVRKWQSLRKTYLDGGYSNPTEMQNVFEAWLTKRAR